MSKESLNKANVKIVLGMSIRQNTLADVIKNNPESKMRVGIKNTEEQVSKESKLRKIKAPLTTVEKVLLNV